MKGRMYGPEDTDVICLLISTLFLADRLSIAVRYSTPDLLARDMNEPIHTNTINTVHLYPVRPNDNELSSMNTFQYIHKCINNDLLDYMAKAKKGGA